MVESDNLIDRIKKDLEKSGFGSEMQAIRTFLERGWACSGGLTFVDREEGKSREFDVLAHYYEMHRLKSGRAIRIFTDVSVEVKKSEKPWVVFKHVPNSDDDLFHGWTEVLNYSEQLPYERAEFTDIFDDHSLTTRLGWKGYAVHESFKNPDQPSRWYAAAVTACKAAHHQLDINYDDPTDVESISPDVQQFPPLLHLSQPLVVLDGLLFVAEISGSGELIISPARMTSVDFHFSSEAYEAETYRMPLLTLEALPEYLNLVEQRSNAFLQAIVEAAGVMPDK